MARTSAWIRQKPSQIRKLGKENASWFVEWREPDGRQRCQSCGSGSNGKKTAERKRDRLRAELLTGTYQQKRSIPNWKEFCDEYSDKVLSNLKVSSQHEIELSLRKFTSLIKPRRIEDFTSQSIVNFIAKRKKERGRKPGSNVSPATINKDLRHLRGALNTAIEWEYLDKAPKIKFLREPKKLPRYITPEHFAAIYQSCDAARFPNDIPYPVGDWWRGLLVMAQMTGWRIGELLSLKWCDVDLENAMAITRHNDNKGRRDAKVPLHTVVIDHLKRLQTDNEFVFPWTPHRRTLDSEFARIQVAAEIDLPCPDAGVDVTCPCFMYQGL